MVPSLYQEEICSDLVFLRVLCFFSRSTCSHPFFHRYWVNLQVQLQPSIRWITLFYYKRAIAATHSFKFTVFLQNRNRSKEVLILIMIPPWFQAYVYWKKSVMWHHFQPTILSMIVSLFHGCTWSNPHVKETVYISQHLLQPSIITSSLWLTREKLKSMFIWGKPL